MVAERPANPSFKSNKQQLDTIAVSDDTLLAIQQGYIIPRLHYGDQTQTDNYNDFTGAIDAAKGYAGFISQLQTTVPSREQTFSENKVLTAAEYSEVQKVAKSISAFGNVPTDISEEMLLTIIAIDDIEDMQTIANAAQIPDLNDSNILLNPLAILAVSGLSKLAAISSAFYALTSAFDKFNAATSLSNNLLNGYSGVLSNIGSVLGGFGGTGGEAAAKQLLNNASGADALGSFMSEQVVGRRLPMSVITKNPSLHPPSYVGRSFFGEFPTSRMLVDLDQTLPKRIAVFGQHCCGAGTPMFSHQNMGRFAKPKSLSSVINNMLFGKETLTSGTQEHTVGQNVTSQVASLLNVSTDTNVELRRPDNSIPVMLAVSVTTTNPAGTKSAFPSSVFREGWYVSSSIKNDLQVSNPDLLDGLNLLT